MLPIPSLPHNPERLLSGRGLDDSESGVKGSQNTPGLWVLPRLAAGNPAGLWCTVWTALEAGGSRDVGGAKESGGERSTGSD